MSAGEQVLASPCIGVCRLDEATGWCIGCGRSGDELLGWGELAPDRQRAVWARLPLRMARLERSVRLLPWAGASLLERLGRLTREPQAVWRIGVPWAHGEFKAGPDAPLDVLRQGSVLEARHPRGRLRIEALAGLRALLKRHDDGTAEVALALHRSRLRELPETRITAIPEATGDQAQPLFDLGLGVAGFRFCIAAAAPRLATALLRAQGQRWDADPEIAMLLARSAFRCVLSMPGIRLTLEATSPRAPNAGPEVRFGAAAAERLEAPWLPEGYGAFGHVSAPLDAFSSVGLDRLAASADAPA